MIKTVTDTSFIVHLGTGNTFQHAVYKLSKLYTPVPLKTLSLANLT